MSSVRHAPGMPFSRPRRRRPQWKLKSPRRLLVTRRVDASLTGICDISDIKWYIYIYIYILWDVNHIQWRSIHGSSVDFLGKIMYLLSWHGMRGIIHMYWFAWLIMFDHVDIWCSIRGWFSRANNAKSSVWHAPGMPFSRPRGRRLQWKLKSPRRLLVTRCIDASLIFVI